MKKIVFLIFIIIQNQHFFGDDIFYGQLITSNFSISKDIKANFKKNVEAFEVYEINALEIFNYTNKKSAKSGVSFTLKLGDKHNWQFNLKEHNLFSDNFREVVLTDNGKEISYSKPDIKSFRGFNETNNKKAIISIGSNWIYGYLTDENDIKYFIEPLQLYSKEAKANQYVVYNSNKTNSNEFVCGQDNTETVNFQNKINKASLAVICTETAIAYDQSTKDLNGGTRNTQNLLTSRFNSVSAFFLDNFEIDKKIVEFYEANLNEITLESSVIPCYENFFPSSCGNGSILESFRQWNESEFTGFTSNPDAATFFTGRTDVEQYAGYSFIGGICTSRAYNWVDTTAFNLEYMKVNLWIHEFGHTWGGDHAFSTGASMMSPTISSADPMPVIDRTLTNIANHKNSRSCLITGSCSPPLSVNQYNLFDVKIFPNPTKGLIKIKAELGLNKIEIYNSLGQKIIQTNEFNIDVSSLLNGVYFMKIYGERNEILIKKIIKE